MKIRQVGVDFKKSANIKFNKNPSSGCRFKKMRIYQI